MTIVITIFSSSSTEGKVLENNLYDSENKGINSYVASLLREKIGRDVDVEINSIHSDALEYEFHKAVLYSDVVIFDGSLEEDGIALGENYACIPHANLRNADL